MCLPFQLGSVDCAGRDALRAAIRITIQPDGVAVPAKSKGETRQWRRIREALECCSRKEHYEIPEFQQPYVWNEEDQWAPL
jgi:hypothetical protein